MNSEWIGLVGVLLGVLISGLVQMIMFRLTSGREERVRAAVSKQEAYVNLLCLFDQIAGDAQAGEQVSRGPELNRAYAIIDLLAPPHVCDAATKADLVAHFSLENSERIHAMETLVNAMREDLAIRGGVWRQLDVTAEL